MKKRGESELWLDYYAKYQFIEYYRKRVEELELVQKKLLRALIEQTEKKENPNKLLINQLSKTIGENSKILAEFGMALPLLSRIKNLIMIKSDSAKNNNNDVDNEDLGRLKILHQNTKSGVYLNWIMKKLLENARISEYFKRFCCFVFEKFSKSNIFHLGLKKSRFTEFNESAHQ